MLPKAAWQTWSIALRLSRTQSGDMQRSLPHSFGLRATPTHQTIHCTQFTLPPSATSILLLLLLTIAGFGLVSLSRTKPTFKTFPSFYFISCAPEIRSDFVCFRLPHSLSFSPSLCLSLWLCRAPLCSLYFHFSFIFFRFSRNSWGTSLLILQYSDWQSQQPQQQQQLHSGAKLRKCWRYF